MSITSLERSSYSTPTNLHVPPASPCGTRVKGVGENCCPSTIIEAELDIWYVLQEHREATTDFPSLRPKIALPAPTRWTSPLLGRTMLILRLDYQSSSTSLPTTRLFPGGDQTDTAKAKGDVSTQLLASEGSLA